MLAGRASDGLSTLGRLHGGKISGKVKPSGAADFIDPLEVVQKRLGVTDHPHSDNHRPCLGLRLCW